MRKNDHLFTVANALGNLMNRVISPKAVHAREWIIENNNLGRSVRVLFQLGQKKRECERASVAGAQRISETRPVGGGICVSKIDGILINDNLVGGAGLTPSVSVGRRRYSEPGIDPFQIVVYSLPVLRDDPLRVSVELPFGLRLLQFERSLFNLKCHMSTTKLSHRIGMTNFLSLQLGERIFDIAQVRRLRFPFSRRDNGVAAATDAL